MKSSSFFRLLCTLLISFMLSSCIKTGSGGIRSFEANSFAKKHGFTKKLVKGGDFWLTTYQHITDKNKPYVFYIESDGFINLKDRPFQISTNPTPLHPMLLKLAARDERPNIVYIARPCQYTEPNLNPQCDQSYWMNKRMSEEVIYSINDAIGKINNSQKFSLVGYSGGGGIAVLIAARNKNVKDVLTIAANLDHVAFNKYHNARPMLGSLNPIDFASKIRDLPQLHVSGGRDETVPPFIGDKYIQVSNSLCVHQTIIEEVGHYKGWERVWEYILTLPVSCYKN